ncbi:MAG: cyclic nucleotide-binding domain-containing protein [Acidobacteriota bacterium]
MAGEQLGAQDVFRFLRPEQVDAISKVAVMANFGAGEAVYNEGAKARYVHIILEGQVALHLPAKDGISILVDQLGPGAILGASSFFDLDSYMLTARCLTECKILRIEMAVLRRMMEEDPRMGYAIQLRISEIFFKRYVDALHKLQAILTKIPVEAR